MGRPFDYDENNDFGEYDLIPVDNDYPSDEEYVKDAPVNLCQIPAELIPTSKDMGGDSD